MSKLRNNVFDSVAKCEKKGEEKSFSNMMKKMHIPCDEGGKAEKNY